MSAATASGVELRDCQMQKSEGYVFRSRHVARLTKMKLLGMRCWRISLGK
jgi:hypothetical protein